MPGHPTAERDADRGDLALADPHAAEPRALPRGDAEIGERRDEDALEHLEIPAHVGPEGAEPDDRVADQLPGPVVGDLAAAVRPEDRHVARRRRAEKARVGAAAQGVDGRMLEEEERVGPAGEPPCDQRLLPGERAPVLDPSGEAHLEPHGRIRH